MALKGEPPRPFFQAMSAEAGDLWELWAADTAEAVRTIEASLVVLAVSPADPTHLRALYRGFHGLKGSAAFLRLRTFERTAHACERLVGRVRDGGAALGAVLPLVHEALELLRAAASEVQRTRCDVDLRAVEGLLGRVESAAGARAPDSIPEGAFVSFSAPPSPQIAELPRRPIRVLIVDDSALVRSILTRGLSADPELEVVGAAVDPFAARDLLVRLRPDVMTLDVEMPRMDGVTFLRKVMATLPTPAIVLSSLTPAGSRVALEALEAGAVDVVEKPKGGAALTTMMSSLIERLKVAARSPTAQRAAATSIAPQSLPLGAAGVGAMIGLGASTGGVAALGKILPTFPACSPGIVVVQHMPAGFTADFSRRLDATCAMRVREAKHGDRIVKGEILVAPGGTAHLEVRRTAGELRVVLKPDSARTGHAPSVDVFFASLARHVGANAAACLLTGMGRDGAEGLLALRRAGGRTFVQDADSSVVWGMPGAAHALGAAEACVPLERIPVTLSEALRDRRRAPVSVSTAPSR